MRPERLIVAPVLHLRARGDRERVRSQATPARRPEPATRGRSVDERSGRPNDHHEHTNERNVGVAIGHRLPADLHETDDRHERADSEPADGWICAPARHNQRGKGDARENGGARHDLPRRYGHRVRVIHVEVRRPDRLEQIHPVTDDRGSQCEGRAESLRGGPPHRPFAVRRRWRCWRRRRARRAAVFRGRAATPFAR